MHWTFWTLVGIVGLGALLTLTSSPTTKTANKCSTLIKGSDQVLKWAGQSQTWTIYIGLSNGLDYSHR